MVRAKETLYYFLVILGLLVGLFIYPAVVFGLELLFDVDLPMVFIYLAVIPSIHFPFAGVGVIVASKLGKKLLPPQKRWDPE